MVPQGFRYEEVPAGASEEEMFSSARTTSASQSGSVIVVDVPTDLIEVAPGVQVNIATLLASLNWLPSWYRPDGKLTPEEIAHRLADQLLGGLIIGR